MNALLSLRGITKSFPGVQALAELDLDLFPGEVLAIVGENGAGKSTLIKILGGAHVPDAGTVQIADQPVVIASPIAARRVGITVIYQEFNLVPELSARDNIFLGGERCLFSRLHRNRERRRAEDLLQRIGFHFDPDLAIARLSVAQQQAVEIARALSQDARILIMDEPTATLTPPEVQALLNIIRELRRQGLGIIYVSHRLDEIFAIADCILVLRDGKRVSCGPANQESRKGLIEKMVGRILEQEFPARRVAIGEPRLVVDDLCRGEKVRNVSLEIHRGEILALTGLVGAGRTETARLIFGADPPDSGAMVLDGKPLDIRCPRDAIRAGICLITEDRKSQGLILDHTVLENFSLPNLRAFSRFGFLRKNQLRQAFAGHAGRLGIKVRDGGQLVNHLSGGNQQKVVLAKWLQASAEVILFDEPTRGIDVGAKREIYLLMNDLAARGKAILMISSELEEVLGMADRIVVMHEGRITGIISDVAGATQENILQLAVR
ncbi:MAG TPA: sugar ABC transporter ATP-binding protein [Gemmataceae bacterium]|nr:sugar ABC transporter ATP-binding protein [Gemmataceae bacterium]